MAVSRSNHIGYALCISQYRPELPISCQYRCDRYRDCSQHDGFVYFEKIYPNCLVDLLGVSIAVLGDTFYFKAIDYYIMSRTIELSDELARRLEDHLEGDETVEEFIEELVGIYEQEERFSDPGL